MKVPTPLQLTALVRAAEADDPVLSTAVALAGLSGLRRGEAWRCGGPTWTWQPERSTSNGPSRWSTA